MFTKEMYEKARDRLLDEHQKRMEALNMLFGILGKDEPSTQQSKPNIPNGSRLTIDTVESIVKTMPPEFSFQSILTKVKELPFKGGRGPGGTIETGLRNQLKKLGLSSRKEGIQRIYRKA